MKVNGNEVSKRKDINPLVLPLISTKISEQQAENVAY